MTGALLSTALSFVVCESGSLQMRLVFAALLLLPASEAAIAFIQRLASRFAPPRRLPRLDLQAAIPDDARTLVVVPTLLTSAAGAKELVEHIEVLALGNLDPRIPFAILGDFADANARETPDDDPILNAARSGIAELNARLSEGRGDRFFLLHRERRWNPSEGSWMGWERKRGKIEELNRLLRGATDTSFAVQAGDLSVLPRTLLHPLDSLRLRMTRQKLIDHRAPAEPARYEATLGGSPKATRSWPRVSVTASSAAGSRFARPTRHTGVIPTPRPFRTSIRTSSAKGYSPARDSTTSTPSWRR